MNLLSKPLKAFTFYSLLILLLSIPSYYLIIDWIWTNEVDEYNELSTRRVTRYLEQNTINDKELDKIIETWKIVEPETSIIPFDSSTMNYHETIYEITKINPYDDSGDEDRFRGMRSIININGRRYLISVETNVEEETEIILPIALVTAFFFIILILGFIFLNKQISRTAWKPFYNTLKNLKDFNLSKNVKFKIEPTDIKEIQQLQESLQLLIRNNIDIYSQQKTFIENASHELQTPIAILKSKLNILLQSPIVAPDTIDTLDHIELALARLSRINKNLLLLAKVENQHFKDEVQISIPDLLKDCISLFDNYIESEKLSVHLIEQSPINTKANLFLVETAICNLLSNSIKNSPYQGNIEIFLKHNCLSISNYGEVPLDSEKLFQRFTQVKKDKVGSGLGLAIVKEIANRYNWNISYHHHAQSHFFTLSFKKF